MSQRLHVEVYGQGVTVVVLHGWGMHSGVLRSFAQRLAQQARVVCVDLPGHGRSPLAGEFVLPTIAAQILAELDAMPCYWLGWSMGGLVALEVARQAPVRVLGTVLLAGTPCFARQADWPGIDMSVLALFAQDLIANHQAVALRNMALQVHGLPNAKLLLRELKTALEECASPDAAVLLAGLLILQHQDLRPVLQALTCPVLMLLGARDALVPVAVAKALPQLAPAVRVSVLEDAGHVPFLSHAEETVAAIAGFIHA